MKNPYTIVTYQNKQYVVALTNKEKTPFVFDAEQLTKLPNRSFYLLKNGYIGVSFNRKNIYFHHIIKPYNGISIDHINQIKTDNREVNLHYATQSEQNKNQPKKKRIVKLPENCNINPQNIPTFIWYIRQGTHGDRWVVEIKNKYLWKTTSTKLLSTKCKLELAKQHLRNLIQKDPKLFEGHCINGKLNEKAEILKQEYIEILKLANIKYKDSFPNNFLQEDNTSLLPYEIEILNGEDMNSVFKRYNLKESKETKIIVNNNLNEENPNIDQHISLDQNTHKEYLKHCFEEFIKIKTQDLVIDCKYKEILNTKTNKQAETQIFNPLLISEWLNLNIKPMLEFCETNSQLALYSYFRKKVSSLPTTGIIGRSIRILVKDTISNKYIGIMCLSSDVYSLGKRDTFFDLTSNNKNEELKNIMNLSCCVPLQPFGFNTTGGKLIASLAFSKEIFDYYFKKYNEPLLGITTTSINGKSIQYDRLKCLKFIGFTKGYGTVYFPDELYEQCRIYNKKWNILPKRKRIDRLDLLKSILTHLGLSKNVLFHGIKRGIYCGYIFSTKLSKQYDINELETVDQIYNYWKNRWYTSRIKNLLKNNNIKHDLQLYTVERFHNLNFVKYNLPEPQTQISISYNNVEEQLDQTPEISSQPIPPTPISTITNEIESNQSSNSKNIPHHIISYIIEMYFKNMTTQEVSSIIKKTFNYSIKRNIISQIWKGELKFEELESNPDYQKMIRDPRQRLAATKILLTLSDKFPKNEFF